MIRPKLKVNDKVSLQSLSGGMAGDKRFYHRFLIGKDRIEHIFNLEVIASPNSLKGFDFINDNPDKRAKDLMDAINDPTIQGIIANIGGIDSSRIWPFIDLKSIKAYPKILVGYSDITSVHLMFYKAGVQSYYGPAVLDGFAENVKMHQYTIDSFNKAVFKNATQHIESANEWTSEFLDFADESLDQTSRKMNKEKQGFIFSRSTGAISGHLIGGNLDTIIKIKDEEFFPNLSEWNNAIIFLETSEEKMKPEIFRKSILSLQKEIDVCSGLIFGKPKDETYFNEYLSIIQELIIKPFVFNMNFGHTAPLLTIPYGGNCMINFKNKKIKIS
ncbi:S66 family peptidase [Candidatus Mycoplasma mahonii]|uniref:S66 family peptidase n=1 Tax=Candidatus Mycoplasma mahonii TaxID=3004105 RepID=UPI0026EBCAB4|nr:S66 peptidase family protein [Candidatus Mycoplasma mahonii]WKX02356.1 LD-carboxypeptidase [Candidatus Mycoplasma mahonii]